MPPRRGNVASPGFAWAFGSGRLAFRRLAFSHPSLGTPGGGLHYNDTTTRRSLSRPWLRRRGRRPRDGRSGLCGGPGLGVERRSLPGLCSGGARPLLAVRGCFRCHRSAAPRLGRRDLARFRRPWRLGSRWRSRRLWCLGDLGLLSPFRLGIGLQAVRECNGSTSLADSTFRLAVACRHPPRRQRPRARLRRRISRRPRRSVPCREPLEDFHRRGACWLRRRRR
mmetsp:Transcript_3992/g.8875  ORF Transcript_3992/g.8875 Transcript_3992/m.8875 type:complete len:224 (-) Transcript_3992:181-852(-)